VYCIPMSQFILKKKGSVTVVTIFTTFCNIFSQSSPIISRNIINWLIFVLEVECVLCEVVMPYICDLYGVRSSGWLSCVLRSVLWAQHFIKSPVKLSTTQLCGW
jgi:hypothetical protein